MSFFGVQTVTDHNPATSRDFYTLNTEDNGDAYAWTRVLHPSRLSGCRPTERPGKAFTFCNLPRHLIENRHQLLGLYLHK